MKGKSFLTKLEGMVSLTQIIWIFLAGLLFLYILLTFSDSVTPHDNKVIRWGKGDPKSQLP